MKLKKKKHLLARARRRYHRAFFLLGALVGGALGFNLRKLVDAAVERVVTLKK